MNTPKQQLPEMFYYFAQKYKVGRFGFVFKEKDGEWIKSAYTVDELRKLTGTNKRVLPRSK